MLCVVGNTREELAGTVEFLNLLLRAPPREESGIYELDKKPLFVYTGEDVDAQEQSALFAALGPAAPRAPSPPASPREDPAPPSPVRHASPTPYAPPSPLRRAPPSPLGPPSPRGFGPPKDDVQLMHERRNSGSVTPPSPHRQFSLERSSEGDAVSTCISPNKK